MQGAPLKKKSSGSIAPSSPGLRERAARQTARDIPLRNTSRGKSRGKSLPRKKSTIGSQYHEDMTIKFLGTMVDGKRNGDGKEFWSNGKLYYDGNYQNGFPHGEACRLNHENGDLWYKGVLVEGVKEGLGGEFYEGGQVMFEGEWRGELVRGGRGGCGKVETGGVLQV